MGWVKILNYFRKTPKEFSKKMTTPEILPELTETNLRVGCKSS